MLFNHPFKRIMLLYPLASGGAKRCRPFGRGEHSLDRVGECRGIAGQDKQAVDTILHYTTVARYVAGDDWQTDRHRFEQSNRQSLLERWQDEHIGRQEHVLDVVE